MCSISHPQTHQTRLTNNHWCRSRQIFRGAKDFCPYFPKLHRKIFWSLFLQIFFSLRHFFGTTSKKDFHVILRTLGASFFQIKPCWALFLPIFSGISRRLSQILPRFPRILPGFSPNQNFCGCACTSCTTANNKPEAFHIPHGHVWHRNAGLVLDNTTSSPVGCEGVQGI